MDVALSDIMGLAFAEHLRDYAHSNGVELGPIAKIEQNPDQSKHLETARIKVFGLDLDLVNLRSEEYAKDSRIPTSVVSIGHDSLSKVDSARTGVRPTFRRRTKERYHHQCAVLQRGFSCSRGFHKKGGTYLPSNIKY